MIELKLDPNKKARVWLGELPAVPPGPVERIHEVIHAERTTSRQPGCAAVEAYVHMGPRVRWGLLGGRYISISGDQLDLQVDVARTGEEIDWPTASKSDVVRAGLPYEYVQGVIGGARAVEAGRLLGPGVLRFDCAAHAEAGSSISIFQQLAAVVVRLLLVRPEQPSEPELTELLRLELGHPTR